MLPCLASKISSHNWLGYRISGTVGTGSDSFSFVMIGLNCSSTRIKKNDYMVLNLSSSSMTFYLFIYAGVSAIICTN